MGYNMPGRGPMREFDADLTRAFAALEDPADNGFATAVTRRVAFQEKARAVRGYVHLAAFAVAGGAFAFGVLGSFQAMGPGWMAELGLGLAEAHGALAAGSIPAGIGALLTPLLVAAAAGIGGLAIARAVTD